VAVASYRALGGVYHRPLLAFIHRYSRGVRGACDMPHMAVVYIFFQETIGLRNAYIVCIVMCIFYGSESAIKQGSQRRVGYASCRRQIYILRKKLLPQKCICSAYSHIYFSHIFLFYVSESAML